MGCLFSRRSSDEADLPTPYQPTVDRPQPKPSSEVPSSALTPQTLTNAPRPSIAVAPYFRQPYQLPPVAARSSFLKSDIVSRRSLTSSVFHQLDASEWSSKPLPHSKTFQLVDVQKLEDDYEFVRSAFKGTTQKRFKIVQIKRVENPYLFGCYLLKKEEMQLRYGSIEEEMHFHGTKSCNVDKICENNFDWKLHGESVGNRFGMGVSFSPISYYAAHYSDRTQGVNVMFYARVLVNSAIVGSKGMILPPKKGPLTNIRYDTAIKSNGDVLVKFGDSEFYPEFIIYYTGVTWNSPPKKHA